MFLKQYGFKSIFGMLCILVLCYPTSPALGRPVASPASEPFSVWKTNMLKKTGLKEGQYKLLEGPRWCLEGELTIIGTQLTKAGDATIMIGAKPLLTHIARSNSQKMPEPLRDESQCERQQIAHYKPGLIEGKAVEKCEAGQESYDFSIEIKGENLTYSIVRLGTLAPPGVTVCRMKYLPDQTEAAPLEDGDD